MPTNLLDAMLRAHSEAHAGKPWTDEQWAAIRAELRPDDERVVAMEAVAAVVLKRQEGVTKAVTLAALEAVISAEPPDPEALREAAVAVYNRFAGGSSGLDDMAEEVAADHADTAVRAYLRAREQRFQTVPEKRAREADTKRAQAAAMETARALKERLLAERSAEVKVRPRKLVR